MANLYEKYQEGLVKSLVADPDKVLRVANIIGTEDFDDERYALVYEGIRNLRNDDEEVTLSSIVHKITEKHPESTIDPMFVLDLDKNLSQWVTRGTPIKWAQLLKEEASKHKTADALLEAVNSLRDGSGNAAQIIGQTTSVLNEIAMSAVENSDRTMEDRINDYREYMNTRLDVKKNIIPSPYPTVDKYIVGWLPGQLITIGARTSVGKSVIATQSAVAACVAGKSVQIFSLEMSEFEVMDRMVSAMSNIELSAMRTRHLSQEEQERFDAAMYKYSEFKLDIDENPNVTIEYIKNKAIRRAQSEDGLDMIIIDYLQLVTHEKRNATREQIVAEMSREMKKLAKQLQVPVMILAQLNRESKDDPDDRLPQISDIRESGAIAADSDVILLIHRKLASDEIDPKALFIIGKNRNGQPGKKLSVRCGLEYAKFIDDGLEEAYDHAAAQAEENAIAQEAADADMIPSDVFGGGGDFEMPTFDDYDEEGDLFGDGGDPFGGSF